MAYSALATRTTANLNASADINQLQTNISAMWRNNVVKSSSYPITDSDDYENILIDTTTGDITVTMPLLANNAGRRIKIINSKGGTNKVIINPHATDSSKLTQDGLAAVWLPKIGDYLEVIADSTSGYWDVISERITSELFLDTYAGYGSTDTRIMRFTNSNVNVGNMFSENHASGYSANAKGLEITINRSGVYSISFHTNGAGATGMGLSLNSAQLTTNIDSITVGDRLTHAYVPGVGQDAACSVTKRFAKNDVIRTHTNGSIPSSAATTGIIVTYIG